MKGLAALLALLVSTGAGAQVTMGNSFVKLYFNSTGDLIAPTPKGETPASKGIEYRPNTGAAYQEELAAGLTGIAEGWVLSLNAGGDIVNDANGRFRYSTPVVTGSDLQRTFTMELTDGLDLDTPVLSLTQVVTLSDTGTDADKIARFDITLTNLTGDSLTGLSYLRTVNPRQGLVGTSTPTQDLDFALGSSTFFADGISLLSQIPGYALDDDAQRVLALASDTVGARVSSGGSAVSNLLKTSVGAVDENGYYEWTGSGIDAGAATGSTISTGGPYAINLWFDSNVLGDSLESGQSASFTFYYVLNGGKSTAVPEPGALAMVFAGLGAAGLLWRRRRA